MKLHPITGDDVYDIDDDYLFESMNTKHESVWFVRDDDGQWWARVDSFGPGYMANTYWRTDDMDATLQPMIDASRRRDRGEAP